MEKQEFTNPLNIEGACEDYQPGYLVPRITMPDPESEQFFKDSPASKQTITIYALEGAHGAGKTTLTHILRNLNFHIVEEDFMDVFANFILPGDDSHNCLVEVAWASMQIINLVNMAANIRREILMDPTRFNAFFLDRCFLTGYVYGVMPPKIRKWYLKLFQDCIQSMKTNYNIDFRVIRIKPKDEEEHWKHIQRRVHYDTTGVRKQLKEAEKSHLDNINAGYDQLEEQGLIDYVFDMEYGDTIDPDIVKFPIGRFFECIHFDMLAERYSGAELLYHTQDDELVGFKYTK